MSENETTAYAKRLGRVAYTTCFSQSLAVVMAIKYNV